MSDKIIATLARLETLSAATLTTVTDIKDDMGKLQVRVNKLETKQAWILGASAIAGAVLVFAGKVFSDNLTP